MYRNILYIDNIQDTHACIFAYIYIYLYLYVRYDQIVCGISKMHKVIQVYIYIDVCTHACIYIYIHNIYIYICICVYAYIYIYEYHGRERERERVRETDMYRSPCIHACMHTYIHTGICVYARMYVCADIHTYGLHMHVCTRGNLESRVCM